MEETAWERSSLTFHRQSEFLRRYQEEYAKALLETWTKPVPERGMARKLIVKTYAIELMNIVKLPQVLTRSLETSIGLYLNDYYMVHDAIYEDHDVKMLQLLKAVREHKLETEDPLVSSLKQFKSGMLRKF